MPMTETPIGDRANARCGMAPDRGGGVALDSLGALEPGTAGGGVSRAQPEIASAAVAVLA